MYHLPIACCRNFPPLLGSKRSLSSLSWQDARKQGLCSQLNILLMSLWELVHLGEGFQEDVWLWNNYKGQLSKLSRETVIMANTRQGDEVEVFIVGFSSSSPEKLLFYFSLLSPCFNLVQDSILPAHSFRAVTLRLFICFSLPWKFNWLRTTSLNKLICLKIGTLFLVPKMGFRGQWRLRYYNCVCVFMEQWMIVLVIQLCPTLCNPMDCSPLVSSVHGILQARILKWVVIPFSRASSNPETEPWSTLQVDSLPSEPPGKPLKYESESHSVMTLWDTFVTQQRALDFIRF